MSISAAIGITRSRRAGALCAGGIQCRRLYASRFHVLAFVRRQSAGVRDRSVRAPSYGQYYFGDYYTSNYAKLGFYPSFSYESSRYGYDPIFVHERWEHRRDPNWSRQVQATYENRREHQQARPPRTLAAEQQRERTQGGAARNLSSATVTSYQQFTKRQDNRMRFQPVSRTEQQQYVHRSEEIQKFREDRRGQEAKGATPRTGPLAKGFQPSRAKLPTSPLTSKPLARLGTGNSGSRLHQVLKPELGTTQPQLRRRGAPAEARHRATTGG